MALAMCHQSCGTTAAYYQSVLGQRRVKRCYTNAPDICRCAIQGESCGMRSPAACRDTLALLELALGAGPILVHLAHACRVHHMTAVRAISKTAQAHKVDLARHPQTLQLDDPAAACLQSLHSAQQDYQSGRQVRVSFQQDHVMLERGAHSFVHLAQRGTSVSTPACHTCMH